MHSSAKGSVKLLKVVVEAEGRQGYVEAPGSPKIEEWIRYRILDVVQGECDMNPRYPALRGLSRWDEEQKFILTCLKRSWSL